MNKLDMALQKLGFTKTVTSPRGARFDVVICHNNKYYTYSISPNRMRFCVKERINSPISGSKAECIICGVLLYHINKSDKCMGWMSDEQIAELDKRSNPGMTKEQIDMLDPLDNNGWMDIRDNNTTIGFIIDHISTCGLMVLKNIELSTWLIAGKRVPNIATYTMETDEYDNTMDDLSIIQLIDQLRIGHKDMNNLIDFINIYL